MPKIVPDILKDHVLPFNWDVRTVWELKADAIELPTSEFTYLLKLPLWSSVPKEGMLFDICPMDVIDDPQVSIYQTQRLRETELQYPIDILAAKGRRWILDGIHRIAKNFSLNNSIIAVRIHDKSVIPKIKIG